MDAVAAAAGVGKGTVFRRFESREGLMAAVLNHSETEWQASVMSGPPPLGPGAEPWDRLLAFGRSRLETILRARRADPAPPAEPAPGRTRRTPSSPCTCATCCTSSASPATCRSSPIALLAPLEAPILDQQVTVDGFPLERVYDGWVDLARRIAGTRPADERLAGGHASWRRSPKVTPSTSAPQDASITLAPTPTVTHEPSPSLVSISTRVIASVP